MRDILTIPQACKVMDVCEPTLRKLMADEGLPTVKLGRNRRIISASLMAWLKLRETSLTPGLATTFAKQTPSPTGRNGSSPALAEFPAPETGVQNHVPVNASGAPSASGGNQSARANGAAGDPPTASCVCS